MKKIIPLLLTLLLSTPALAQSLGTPALKQQAIATMSMTPLAGMDKESSMLIAAYSYECAAYYVGMTVVARHLSERGQLEEDFDLQKFTRQGQRIGGIHIALSEIIHVIYDLTVEEDMVIMTEQGKKVNTAINNTEDTQDLDDKYGVPCQAILQTYLPNMFKKEEKNGA